MLREVKFSLIIGELLELIVLLYQEVIELALIFLRGVEKQSLVVAPLILDWREIIGIARFCMSSSHFPKLCLEVISNGFLSRHALYIWGL